jgi:hypothetical protein
VNIQTAIRAICFGLLTLTYQAFAQDTVIVNDTGHEMQFSMSPVGGTWIAEQTSALGTTVGLNKFNPTIRRFVIPSRETVDLPCVGCSGFEFANGMRLSGSKALSVGKTYRFQNGNPIYRVLVSGQSRPLQGLNTLVLGIDAQIFMLNRPVPHRAHCARSDAYDSLLGFLKVTLSKENEKGVWLINDYATIKSRVTLRARVGITKFLCAACGMVAIIRIAGQSVRSSLHERTLYQIEQRGSTFTVVEDPCEVVLLPQCGGLESPFGQLPSCPEAPAGAAGVTYLVNAQGMKLDFLFTADGIPHSTFLLGREGRNFECLPSCQVEIRTGAAVVTRSLQPGKSYLIVLTADNLYDLRVYSQ